MSKPTPRPWGRELAQDGEHTGPGDNPPGYAGDWYETEEIISADDEGYVERVASAYRPADAAFIVRACNAHDDLLDLVKLLADIAQIESPKTIWGGWDWPNIKDRAAAAIAKATGEPTP